MDDAATAVATETVQQVSDEPTPPKVTTIEIDGRQVPVRDIAASFDPRCKNSCNHGMLVRLQRAPQPKDNPTADPQYLRFAEICMCAIKRWRKANPPPLHLETDDVSAAIAAVDAKTTPAKPGHHVEHLARLRDEEKKQRAALHDVVAQIGEETAPLVDVLAELDASVDHLDGKIADDRLRMTEIDAQLAEYESALKQLRKRRSESEDAITTAEQMAITARAQASTARRRVELAGDRRREERRVIERKLDQVEKRIARVVERHPELADDR